MATLSKQLHLFILQPGDLRDFRLVLDGVSLDERELLAEQLVGHRTAAGLYLWILKLGDHQYKLYLGRTRSLQRRVDEYCRPFQPHSPNDFKLRVIEAFARRQDRTAILQLFFKCLNDDLQLAETDAINHLSPLLNKLPRVGEQDKDKAAFEKAFVNYYTSVVKRKMGTS